MCTDQTQTSDDIFN